MTRCDLTATAAAQHGRLSGFTRRTGALYLAALVLLLFFPGEGAAVTYTCNNILSTNPAVCSGHGACTANDTCTCSPGYTGADCEAQVFTCNGIVSTNPAVCSGHGACIADDTCTCSPGYTGPNCAVQVFTCNNILSTNPAVCSGHGACIGDDTCTCNPGYTGADCEAQIFTCFGKLFYDPTVCSGHGSCTANDTCTCNSGWTGVQCAETLTSTTTSIATTTTTTTVESTTTSIATTTAPATTTTVPACIDNDADGYGEGCPAGDDCDDSDPAVHDNCAQCNVRILPKNLGWFIGENEKIRFLLAIGSRDAAFDENTPVSWNTDFIETLKTRVFFKRFMLMKINLDGAQLEKGDYTVSVGGCTGTVHLVR